MAKPPRCTDTLSAGQPVTLGGLTLLPIERTRVLAQISHGRPWVAASKQVHVLILRDAAGLRAFDADARPLPLAQLRQQLPDLDAWLARL